MKDTVHTETATVTLGLISAHGVVDHRFGEYTTVRFGEGPRGLMTGKEVPRQASKETII